MNDYQEYRSYGSYLSRVLAIIIAFVLLVLAIWFVVRLASDDNEGTIGEGTSQVVSIDSDRDEEPANNGRVAVVDSDAPESTSDSDVVVEDADNSTANVTVDGDDNVAISLSDEEGQTLSTNTDVTSAESSNDAEALPNTGASFSLVFALPVVAYFASKFALSAAKQ